MQAVGTAVEANHGGIMARGADGRRPGGRATTAASGTRPIWGAVAALAAPRPREAGSPTSFAATYHTTRGDKSGTFPADKFKTGSKQASPKGVATPGPGVAAIERAASSLSRRSKGKMATHMAVRPRGCTADKKNRLGLFFGSF